MILCGHLHYKTNVRSIQLRKHRYILNEKTVRARPKTVAIGMEEKGQIVVIWECNRGSAKAQERALEVSVNVPSK